ncbi:phospholipase-like protein [Tanacetum coccineum]
MLRKQHKVDSSHYDMPLIYYTEGHSLHFGRPEFALITGLPFGDVNFGLYTSGELKFRNRVFPHKLGSSVTNLDLIGVIEDEETFQKLCDEDSIRLCLILCLEVIFMGRLLTCPVDDTLFRLVESLEDWNCFPWGEHIWTHLYDQIQNVIEKHSDEHYFGMKKDPKYVPMYTLSGFVFAFQVWIFESFERCNCWWIKYPNVIPRAVGWSKKSIFNRSDCGYLFAKESTTTSDIRPTKAEYESSWWIRSQLFFRQHVPKAPVVQHHSLYETYLAKLEKSRKRGHLSFITSLGVLTESSWWIQELRLCLEAEERMRLEHEKNIIEEQRFRVNEAKRMKLEEEKLLEISELKKKAARVYEFNSCEKHIGKDLSRSFHLLDTVWLTPDIQRFISREGKIKCKFPWSDDYTVGRNLWLTLVCLDPTRKGYLSEEHIDLWVDYMWHGRPDNANWAMVSCYFLQILLQNSTPLFYANGDKYATPWSDVDQVFFPINETAQHWCLAHFDILFGLVTFYDSGDTYDYKSRDLYVRVQECLQLFEIDNERDFRAVRDTYASCQVLNLRCQERREQMIKMQPFLHLSTVLAESYNLLKELQDYELEKCRDLMKSISETQLKERFQVFLGATKVFKKKGIDHTDYFIRVKLADPVPKQGGIFGDCGVWNATSHLEHLNGMIEMLEGMHFTLEIYDSVWCLREMVKSENKKLLDLKKHLVVAEEYIRVKEKCLEILEEAIYSN